MRDVMYNAKRTAYHDIEDEVFVCSTFLFHSWLCLTMLSECFAQGEG